MMTRTQADEVAAALKATKTFTRVRLAEFGFLSGNFEVFCSIENARTGNDNTTVVRDYPVDAAKTAKAALATAKAADRETLARFHDEQTNQF